jgi:hypothetical protein
MQACLIILHKFSYEDPIGRNLPSETIKSDVRTHNDGGWREAKYGGEVGRCRGEEMARNKTVSHHPNAISSLFDPLEPRAHNSLKWNISESLFRFTSRAGCFYFSLFFFFSSLPSSPKSFPIFLDRTFETFNALKAELVIYSMLLPLVIRCSSMLSNDYRIRFIL